MNLDNCLKVGQIVKAHGIQGDVVIEWDEEHPEEYEKLESVFVEINQKLVPFFIESIQVNGKRGIVKFEDLESVEETKLILRRLIYIKGEQLPEQGDFYHQAIIGFIVKDKSLGEIGRVIEYMEKPGQDLLLVDYNGKEVFIPVDPDIVKKADRKKQILTVDLPEGLLDL